MIEIRFTPQQIAVIYQGLGELPLKVSGPLFSYIQQKVQDYEKHNSAPSESSLQEEVVPPNV